MFFGLVSWSWRTVVYWHSQRTKVFGFWVGTCPQAQPRSNLPVVGKAGPERSSWLGCAGSGKLALSSHRNSHLLCGFTSRPPATEKRELAMGKSPGPVIIFYHLKLLKQKMFPILPPPEHKRRCDGKQLGGLQDDQTSCHARASA